MLVPEKLLCDSETDTPASACNHYNFGGHDGNMVGFATMFFWGGGGGGENVVLL